MQTITFSAMILMTLLSFMSIFNIDMNNQMISPESFILIIGLGTFFITNKNLEEGLSFQNLSKILKNKKIIALMLLPSVMNVVCNLVAQQFVPEFIEHLLQRTSFLDFQKMLILIISLMISALGEEITWRAFYQKQLTKRIPFIPALIISSFLFAICHYNDGQMSVVIYDLIFVFINSVLYGIVFEKTDNAFVSALSHFIANFSGICMITLFFS